MLSLLTYDTKESNLIKDEWFNGHDMVTVNSQINGDFKKRTISK